MNLRLIDYFVIIKITILTKESEIKLIYPADIDNPVDLGQNPFQSPRRIYVNNELIEY